MELEILQEQQEAPLWMTEDGFTTLSNGYLLPDETPKQMWLRVSNAAASQLKRPELAEKFFNLFWNNILCGASPVLSNMGTARGLPISCNTIHISDSCDSIFKKQHELAMLSKNGAGVGIYVGDIRGRGASITGNGKSEGLIPWLKCFDSTTMAISQGCYDDQTEILTEYGWKLFKDLPSCKTTVAQINENNEIEFTKYSDFISYHVDEELFHFTNTIQSVDMLVTGNHNMLVEHKKRITNKRDSAGKFINHEKRWGNKLHSVRADAVKLHNCNRMWTSAPSSVRNNLKLSPEDQFAIAYQADGSTNPVGSSNGKISGTLLHTFHFSKERKISRLKEILDSIGYFYTTSIQADSNTTFFVRIPEFKVPSKNLSDEFKLNEMSAQFAQDFIQEIGHWDGSFRTESGDDGISYSCVIQDNIDFVQAVATLAGYFTNKGITANREGNRQDLHTLLVSFNRHSVGGEYLEVKKKHYNGMVYCVTVPSHKLVVRRGGRTLICGNSTRRGASAVYLPADHIDIEEFLQVRRPTGDVNRRCANLHHAVCIDDAFIGRLKSKDSHTRNIWKEILKTRYEAGEPYLLFTDNVNRQLPISYQKLNLKVKSSNICSEIMLYTDNDHTFVCCLSSLNLTTYHKWKGTDAVQLSIWFLDGVIQEYIEKAKGKSGLEAAVRFAEKSRAVGLGVLGWHSLLQQQKIAFESFAAMQLNAEIFRYIQSEAQIATQELAKVYGEVEWTKDCGVRNTHLMALAPTVSNSIISGDHSAGIEPFTANVFSQKTAKGTFLKFNAQLKQMLQEKGKDSLDTWKSINEYDGSVQHLNFLSDDEKSLFKTGIEIDQEVIVRQAAQRQKWVDQGQSLNLFFSKSVDPRYIHKVHLLAHELNLKSLYYMRTQSILKGDSVSRQQDEDVCKACEG